MKTTILNLLTTASLALGSIVGYAQTPPAAIADSLQSILNSSLPTSFTNSGAVMGIVVPGQWSWYSASGKAIAGITSGQPTTTANPGDLFRVGSITKTMVATCILKLEQDGFLSIDDPIQLYLRSTLVNDTIAPSDTIRIRHLLNHTSGIANSADNTSCQMDVLSNPLGSHTLEEAVYCGASQGELFPAGFAWAYSNTNYSLLAMIIENITGMSYSDFLNQTIITPLGLTQTSIPTTTQIPSAHMGCYWNLGTWTDLTIIHPTTYTGWADVVSNTQDLMAFHSALLNGSIINATELAVMKTIDPMSFDYGMGLDFYLITGNSYVGHYGEVANTSGLFFADIHSSIAPNGYYIAYNFNTQGVSMQSLIDIPVMNLLNSSFSHVENTTPENELHIYPNPAKNHFNLFLEHSAPAMLTICDLHGRVVFTQNILSPSSSNLIDVTNLPAGCYQIWIKQNGSTYIRKLIKE